MDDLSRKQSRRLWLPLGLALMALSTTGCMALATIQYVMHGINVEAEYDGLIGKRVAVVCRPTVSLEYTNTSVARDLSRRVGQRLATNVRKINLIDPTKVEIWCDENTWDEFAEVGQAVDAEMLVAIELDEFGLYSGQTLYQGKATYSLTVYDMATKQPVFERTPPQTLYPPDTGVATSEYQEVEFRRQFVGRLAEEISRFFYDHDAYADFARNGLVSQ